MHCQKCRTPLRLDGSLEDLNPAAYDLLVGKYTRRCRFAFICIEALLILELSKPIATHSQQPPRKPHTSRPAHLQDISRRSLLEKIQQNAGPPVFKRHSAAGRDSGGPRDGPAMSFVLLTESQVAPPVQNPSAKGRDQGRRYVKQLPTREDEKEDTSVQSHEMQRINKLFEILSARSDIDHPICVECTDLLVEEMQKKLEITTRERDMYVNYLRQLQSDAPTDEELRAQEIALQRAKADEASALAELRRLEQEKTALDAELLALEEESRQLDSEEEAFWRSRNDFATKLATFQDERDSINSRFDHDSRLLEKLQVRQSTSLSLSLDTPHSHTVFLHG